MPHVIKQVALRSAMIFMLLAVLGSIYIWLVRPAQLHWGATTAEIGRPMPEDGIVTHPAFDATRAITIHGRPQDIWPWLVQMGFGRAGFYGYDLIENLGSGAGLHSAQVILPALERPRTGDPLPLSVAATLQFGPIHENHYVVWRSQGTPAAGVFIWELVPIDTDHTRLISRIRWRYLPGVQGLALGVFTEFADHVAVRKILQGVRDRVEGKPSEPLFIEALEIVAWLFAFAEFAVSVGFVAFGQRPGAAALTALGAGGLLEFLLYGGVPVWVGALLPCFYLACILRLGGSHARTA